MTLRILPRYLVLTSMLAVVVITVMLSMFYGQYRWLASSIIDTGVEQHYASLAASFERRARARLHRVAHNITASYEDGSTTRIELVLQQAIANNTSLTGIRYQPAEGPTVQYGPIMETESFHGALWMPENLYVSYTVANADKTIGLLLSNFELSGLQADSGSFRLQLLAQEDKRRRKSFLWVATATLVTLSLCGLVIWFIAKTQSMRVRLLKDQALRFSDSDFGEPLPVLHGDELGELAAVFNRMRDKLQTTTYSRDYVDRVLASMNEAIIITSPDNVITRVNDATERLLGYDEGELVGRSLEFIVDMRSGGMLQAGQNSGIPKEAYLTSNTGVSIPVSYTSAVLSGEGGGSGDRIYAAQNITERHKAEQRIRYLARIDALTKVPNRMQFHHLLQRAIARARKSNKVLCLLYIDIDQFKEINDTFGHLAGDTTLETVAQRLRGELAGSAVIGRLAGDEFAVIVNKLDTSTGIRESVDRLASSLLNKLADPFDVQGNEVFMTASMGIAFYPADAPNVSTLFGMPMQRFIILKKAVAIYIHITNRR